MEEERKGSLKLYFEMQDLIDTVEGFSNGIFPTLKYLHKSPSGLEILTNYCPKF